MDSKKHADNEVKGIKLSRLNRSMAIMTGIMVICLFIATAYTAMQFNEMDGSTRSYMEIEKLSDTVYEASDYLTEQVRLFVETTEPEYMELYFQEANVTRRRENALEQLGSYSMDGSGDRFLEAAIQESKDLMEREFYAMRLVSEACGYSQQTLPTEVRMVQLTASDAALKPSAMIDKARVMMYDDTYHHSKATIHEHLYYFTQEVFNGMESGLLGGTDNLSLAISVLWILLGVLIIINILTFAAMFLLVVKPLYSNLNSIKERTLLDVVGSYELKYLARVYNDILAEKEASAKKEAVFKHRSEHDLMTGLLNRTSGAERVRALLAETESNGILILLDLDELKSINDLFGHEAGDNAILGVANTLKNHFRDSDIVARMGGDEFLVYLPDAAENQETIMYSLASLRRKLAAISVGTNKEWHVHCSMGCAIQTPDANTYEALFKQADTALYHVKRGAKNNFAFYVPEMEQEDYRFRENQLLSLQSGKTLETAELQYLLNAITSFYRLLMSVNLDENDYYLMEGVRDEIFACVPVYGSLDTFIETVKKSVHPDDATAFSEHLSRDVLLNAYRQGEKNVCHRFRVQHQDSFRWVESVVILSPNEYGDICDITLFRWTDGPDTSAVPPPIKKKQNKKKPAAVGHPVRERPGAAGFSYLFSQ